MRAGPRQNSTPAPTSSSIPAAWAVSRQLAPPTLNMPAASHKTINAPPASAKKRPRSRPRAAARFSRVSFNNSVLSAVVTSHLPLSVFACHWLPVDMVPAGPPPPRSSASAVNSRLSFQRLYIHSHCSGVSRIASSKSRWHGAQDRLDVFIRAHASTGRHMISRQRQVYRPSARRIIRLLSSGAPVLRCSRAQVSTVDASAREELHPRALAARRAGP